MSADIDWIGLATVDLMANITDQIHNLSPRPVGYGGYSDIYKAVWRSPYGDMQVAVKVIRTLPMSSALDNMPRVLRREIRIWKKLLHRNIHIMCGFYEGYGSAPALVSPWYENGDISSYVQRHATDPNVDTLKFTLSADVMSGLRFLHDHYIIHGDIKGGNVLISDDGVARLCDFGLSRLLLDHSPSITHTKVKGTSRWMAPELLLVDGAQDSYASDIWACGCLFIEIWHNVTPYHTKENEIQLIMALSRKELPGSQSGMPDVAWSVVQACCNFDAGQRPSPLDVVAFINVHLVVQRVLRLVTLGRPIDTARSKLVREIETSLRATDRHQLAGLYILSEADLATEVVRLFGLWSLSPGHSGQLNEVVFRWCLAKLDIRNLHLQVGVRVPTTHDDYFLRRFSVSHEPTELRSLARLVERARPGLGKLMMTQFATSALRSPLQLHMVRSVAWLPSGMRIVAGCKDGIVQILDVASGATLHKLVGHTEYVNQVAVSPSGKVLASCSQDKSIRLWDAETGVAIAAPMIGHADWVCSVAFSPDDRHVVSGSSDATIRVWSTETCTALLGPLRGHTRSVLSVQYSPDGSRIVSGSWDNTVRIWDARMGTPILTLCGHASTVRAVAYSPDGSCIISGSDDCTVRLWDATTGRLVVPKLERHLDWVQCVAYSPDGTRIVSGSDDRTIRIWDAATGASMTTRGGHTSWVYSVAFSPDGKQLASASHDGTVRIWDATDDWRRWDV